MSGCRIGRVRMKNGGADVHVLHNPNKGCNDIPDMLREAANNIESGRVPVESGAAVFQHADDTISIYGWGEYGNRPAAQFIGLMHLGIGEATRQRLTPGE